MKQSLWFAAYSERYCGEEPFFYDASQIEVARELEDHYAQINSELRVLYQGGEMKSYGDDELQVPPRTWSKLVFKVWGIKNKAICEKFSITTSLLEKFPEVTSCFVTKTSAHSTIKAHCGETNAIIRIHLGINVPEEGAHLCGMQVGEQTVGWQNGKAFAFLDAHYHHVWNHSDRDRYVLIVDVLRPEFIRRKNFICVRIITNQLFFNIASRINAPALYGIPKGWLSLTAHLLYLPAMAVIKLNNRFGFIKL